MIKNGVLVKKSNPNKIPALTKIKVIKIFKVVVVMNQLIQNSFELFIDNFLTNFNINNKINF